MWYHTFVENNCHSLINDINYYVNDFTLYLPIVHLQCSRDIDKLDTYREFERTYITNIIEYYKLKSSITLSEIPISEYIRYVSRASF